MVLCRPHVGLDRIWPMSIMIRALTTDDDEEISGLNELMSDILSV